MSRSLTARQRAHWDFALFGNPPVSLPEWRYSTSLFASGTIDFLRAKEVARNLYLQMCRADVSTSELSTIDERVYPILQAWDFLRRLHNSVTSNGGKGERMRSNKPVVAKEPVSGHFPAVDTPEVLPRAMSKMEVQEVLRKIQTPREPLYASLPNKAALEAAIRGDVGLFQQLSPRLVLPLPSKHAISIAIPPQGITVRDVMLLFASQLSIKTITNFLERVFIISAMDPVSKKLLPIMNFDQADALPEGDYRDTMIRATRAIQTPQNADNPKYEAFRHETMDSYFLNQVRQLQVAGSRGRKKHLWYLLSTAADEKTMEEFAPLLEEAEGKRREEENFVVKQYITQERSMVTQKQRKDSVVGVSGTLSGNERVQG